MSVEPSAGMVYLIETDGRVWSGAAALLRIRGQGTRLGWWCYRKSPLVARTAEAIYRWMAAHRVGASRFCRWLVGPDLLPRQHRLTRWLFLRLLGVATLSAFLSLHVQADGLFGEQGMFPAEPYMASVAEYAESMEAAHDQGNPDGWTSIDRYLHVPTLLWMGAGDTWIQIWLIVGIVLSILLILDIAPGPVILALWLVYLSFVTAGEIFLRYQWDSLLLETLFVSLFFAPWRRFWPSLRGEREPSHIGLWLVRLLCFKLMFMSGVVKLLARDEAWNDLTALDFHYYTQPVPNLVSYYVHHLPHWFHALCTVVMFVIELVLPFFMFGPRRMRLLACAGFVLLMILVGLTGNYGFFNLLTVVLAVSLLDDTFVQRFVPERLRSRMPDLRRCPHGAGKVTRGVILACAIPILIMSAAEMRLRFDHKAEVSELTRWALDRMAPLVTINGYGLFADMTTTRPEIEVEGSRDGINWETYEFRYKPDAVDDRPRFAGFHMPRLDWQMWFASLVGCSGARWFHVFMLRLLEGSPAVRALLARDPFGNDPPRYIRSTLYMYTFADMGSPGWWRRERVGPYCPMVTLHEGQLVRAGR